MDKQELMLECLRLGSVLTSPSSHDRHKIVADIGEFLYSKIIAVENDSPNADTPTKKPPGRPPKPRAE